LGVAHVYVFGSTGRGEARDGSDVDIFIDRDPATRMGLMGLAGVGAMLGDILGTRVDSGTRGGLHPAIRQEVEQDAIRVF
jgi:predicted nucleotidyltransferase